MWNATRPPTARPRLGNPIFKLFRQILFFGVLVPSAAGIAMFFLLPGGTGRATAVSVCGIIAGLGLVFSLFAIAPARAARGQLAAFERGDFFAHWTYSPLEWESFHDSERVQHKVTVKLVLAVFLTVALAFVVMELCAPGTGDVFPIFALYMASAGLLLSGFIAYAFSVRHRRSRTSPREAFVGLDGVYLNGGYYPFRGFGVRLIGMEVVPGRPSNVPSVLVVNLRVQSAKGSTTQSVRIPIPRDREGEAREVMRRLLPDR